MAVSEDRRPGVGSFQPPAVLAGNPGFLLGKVHERARERFERALSPLDLTARRFGVLATLAEQGPEAQSVLGSRLDIDRSTMVSVIDELEAAGRVARRRDPRDRRAYRIELTEDGRTVLEQAVQVVGQVQDEVFAPLDRGQRDQLHAVLTVLLRHLAP